MVIILTLQTCGIFGIRLNMCRTESVDFISEQVKESGARNCGVLGMDGE